MLLYEESIKFAHFLDHLADNMNLFDVPFASS